MLGVKDYIKARNAIDITSDVGLGKKVMQGTCVNVWSATSWQLSRKANSGCPGMSFPACYIRSSRLLLRQGLLLDK